MAYTKTNWVNGGTPAVNATNLNKIEQGIYDVDTRTNNVDLRIPIGSVLPFAGSAAPNAASLICNGQAISRTTYATLFSIIGTTYGSGNGSTTFNVPNLSGVVIVGYDSGQAEFNTLNKKAGEKTHQLSSGEMPSHGHTVSITVNDKGAYTGSTDGWWTPQNHTGTGTEGQDVIGANGGGHHSNVTIPAHGHTASGSIGNTGGDGAHNNLQPYIVLNYIIVAL